MIKVTHERIFCQNSDNKPGHKPEKACSFCVEKYKWAKTGVRAVWSQLKGKGEPVQEAELGLGHAGCRTLSLRADPCLSKVHKSTDTLMYT